jgi:hypothetical protein
MPCVQSTARQTIQSCQTSLVDFQFFILSGECFYAFTHCRFCQRVGTLRETAWGYVGLRDYPLNPTVFLLSITTTILALLPFFYGCGLTWYRLRSNSEWMKHIQFRGKLICHGAHIGFSEKGIKGLRTVKSSINNTIDTGSASQKQESK